LYGIPGKKMVGNENPKACETPPYASWLKKVELGEIILWMNTKR